MSGGSNGAPHREARTERLALPPTHPCATSPGHGRRQAVQRVTYEAEMRIFRKTIAVLAALSFLAILAPSLVVGFPDVPARPKARLIKILASPSILKPGTPCRIEVDEHPPTAYRTAVTTYEGTVVEADDEGVRLDVREMRRVDAVPAVSRIPFSDRLFRNVGIARPAPGAKLPPVAIAAAKVRSITVLPAGTPQAAETGKLEFVPPSPLKSVQKP